MWIFRGTLARDARAHVPRLYGLEAPERYLVDARTADEREKIKMKYTAKKVKKLIGDANLYLKCVPKDSNVSFNSKLLSISKS